VRPRQEILESTIQGRRADTSLVADNHQGEVDVSSESERLMRNNGGLEKNARAVPMTRRTPGLAGLMRCEHLPNQRDPTWHSPHDLGRAEFIVMTPKSGRKILVAMDSVGEFGWAVREAEFRSSSVPNSPKHRLIGRQREFANSISNPPDKRGKR
jgi:hypothetical protein